MADLEAYKDRFSDSGQRVFQNAVNESRRRDQNYISVEHIICALSKEEPDLFNSTMRSLALDPLAMKLLNGEVLPGQTIVVSARNDEMKFSARPQAVAA